MTRLRFIVHGKVQGVFYRQSALKVADSLGLNGWIKNNPDGTVECEVSGPHDIVASFVEWCKEGPPRATVEKIEHLEQIDPVEAAWEHGHSGFKILAD